MESSAWCGGTALWYCAGLQYRRTMPSAEKNFSADGTVSLRLAPVRYPAPFCLIPLIFFDASGIGKRDFSSERTGACMYVKIENWEDAGAWSCKSDLALTSVWKRMEAIRKAVLERCSLLDLPDLGEIRNPILPLSEIAVHVDVLTRHLIRLIPHFTAIRNQAFCEVNLLPADGAACTFTDVSVADGVCSADLDCGTLSLHFRNGSGVLSAEENGPVQSMSAEPGKVMFRMFTVEELLEEFPLRPAGKLRTLSAWIRNMYSILSLLRHPALELTLGCNLFADLTRKQKSFDIAFLGNGQYAYRTGSDPYIGTDEMLDEAALWAQAEWLSGSGKESYAYRKRVVYTDPANPAVTSTETAVLRNICKSTGENLTRRSLPGIPGMVHVPVQLEYLKCCTPYEEGDPFLADGTPQGEWVTVYSGTLDALENFDSSGDTPETLPTGGFGSSCDRIRKRTLSCEIDLSDTYGLNFIAEEALG